jgi:hypothetical protein
MTEHRLCPLCATENLMLVPSYEEELFPAGADGLQNAGKVSLRRCEKGHTFLRTSQPNDPSRSFPFCEINIANEGMIYAVGEKWFGKLCIPEQIPADSRVLDFAVALEAMSEAVEHIQQLVNRVWEESISHVGISEVGVESAAELESVGAE